MPRQPITPIRFNPEDLEDLEALRVLMGFETKPETLRYAVTESLKALHARTVETSGQPTGRYLVTSGVVPIADYDRAEVIRQAEEVKAGKIPKVWKRRADGSLTLEDV